MVQEVQEVQDGYIAWRRVLDLEVLFSFYSGSSDGMAGGCVSWDVVVGCRFKSGCPETWSAMMAATEVCTQPRFYPSFYLS